jgi:DNA helicase HerA-like ATPase
MVTSSPSALGSEVLSQVATQLTGKTSQKADLEVLPEEAAVLSAGEWMLSSVNLPRPIKVNVG